MKLGYVCKHQELGTCRKRTIYKKLNSYSKKEQYNILCKITKQNLELLEEIIKDNIKNNIFMFRFSPHLLPFAAHPKIRTWWNPVKEFKSDLQKIGKLINKHNIRISCHPSQFTILTNDNPDITQNALSDINNISNILYIMEPKIPPDIIIHIGGKYNNMYKAIKNFINNFNSLSDYSKTTLRLENDQNSYNILETYSLCKFLNIPMVLDIEHHKYNKTTDMPLNNCFDLFFDTWDKELTPKIHLSSQKENSTIHAHADYINYKDFKDIEKYIKIRDFDIMLEIKKTNLALLKLKKDIDFNKIYIEK